MGLFNFAQGIGYLNRDARHTLPHKSSPRSLSLGQPSLRVRPRSGFPIPNTQRRGSLPSPRGPHHRLTTVYVQVRLSEKPCSDRPAARGAHEVGRTPADLYGAHLWRAVASPARQRSSWCSSRRRLVIARAHRSCSMSATTSSLDPLADSPAGSSTCPGAATEGSTTMTGGIRSTAAQILTRPLVRRRAQLPCRTAPSACNHSAAPRRRTRRTIALDHAARCETAPPPGRAASSCHLGAH